MGFGQPGFLWPGGASGQTRGRTGLPGNGRGAPVKEVSPKITFYGRLHVIAHRATLDVPRELVQFTAKLLAAERRRRGTPAGSRALTCFWEAVLALRWFRDRTSPGSLARDHGISRATAYRYLEEVIEVLAAQAPDLHQALERAKDTGLSHVILDGKIIPADRCKEPAVSVQGQIIDLWYSGEGTHPRRQHPGRDRPGRVPAVGLARRTRLGTRPHRRPPARSPRSLPRRRSWPAHSRRPRLRRRRHRHPYPGQTAHRRAGPRYQHPHPQRHPALPALPGRTRVRPAQPALAHPPAHHRQPQQNRRHRPRRTRPHPLRARLPCPASMITATGDP